MMREIAIAIAFAITANLAAAWAAPNPTTTLAGPTVLGGEAVTVDPAKAAKGTVVVFLSARCPCSASHELALKELAREYEAKGFRFVGIHSNADEAEELTRKHFAEAGLPFPVLADGQSRLADAFGALKTPHAYLLSPKGEILFQGGVDDSHIAAASRQPYLRNALAAVAAGRAPDPAEVRTLGCAIKRP
jgi:peroxiredoxin